MELWFQYGAEGAPHTFDFTGENYADCHTCAVVAGDCVDGECDKRFLVQSGTLEVEEVDLVAGRFRGSLREAAAVEVAFDGSTSTPVIGGESWCIDEIGFDANIEQLAFPFSK